MKKAVWVIFFIIIILTSCGRQDYVGAIPDYEFDTEDNQMDNIKNDNIDDKNYEEGPDWFLGIPVDNNVGLNFLKMPEYTLKELKGYFPEYSRDEIKVFQKNSDDLLTIKEVNEKFPVQVLRNSENVYYTVYKVKEGGYYYVFWGDHIVSSGDGNSRNEKVVDDVIYIEKLKNSADFNSLTVGKSTYEDLDILDLGNDIILCDPSGVYSFSLLEGRKLLRVEYGGEYPKEKNDLIITKKEVIMPETYPATYLVYIFPEDLPCTYEEREQLNQFVPQNPAYADESVREFVAFRDILIDNTVRLDLPELPSYPLQELRDYFEENSEEDQNGRSLTAYAPFTAKGVNERFPIRSLRKNYDSYYTVYKVKEGGYFYVFFTSSYGIYKGMEFDGVALTMGISIGENKIVSDTYYIDKLKKSEDFASLEIGKSTYEDVYSIDSECSFMEMPGSGFIFSKSLLEGRKILEIEYEGIVTDNKKDLIIKDMEIEQINEERPIGNLASILPIDLP